MRVLHLLDKAPGGGGLRVHVETVIAAQRAHGIEARLLRLGHGPASAEEPAAPRTFWPQDGWRHGGTVLAAIAAETPEIVHIHAGYSALAPGVLAAIAARWPTMGTLHDVLPFCPTAFRRFLGGDTLCTRLAGRACISTGCWRVPGTLGPLKREALQAVRARLLPIWQSLPLVTVPSHYLEALALAHGFRPDQVILAPNFTTLPAETAEQAAAPGAPRILFVGALTRAKGADLLIEALAQLDSALPWQADIAGDGPLRFALEARIAELGLGHRVTLHGKLPADALAPLRQAARIAVFPSRIVESFGLAGLETLAASLPIVGVAEGGAADWLVEGETGLGHASGDASSLARGLARLLADPAHAAALGRNGRALVTERFLPRHYLAAIDVAYARLRTSRRVEPAA